MVTGQYLPFYSRYIAILAARTPRLLALNVIYGYGYRAVSSVLFTVYCEITCGGDSPQCGEMSAKLTEGTGCSAPLALAGT